MNNAAELLRMMGERLMMAGWSEAGIAIWKIGCAPEGMRGYSLGPQDAFSIIQKVVEAQYPPKIDTVQDAMLAAVGDIDGE